MPVPGPLRHAGTQGGAEGGGDASSPARPPELGTESRLPAPPPAPGLLKGPRLLGLPWDLGWGWGVFSSVPTLPAEQDGRATCSPG